MIGYVAGTTAQDVLSMVMMTQYFDTLNSLGANSRTNTLIVPHSPSSISDLSSQIREAMISSDMVKRDGSVMERELPLP